MFFMSCLIILLRYVQADATLYISEPALVNQPSYADMRFYVYKPYDMPKGWYITFDGYPVIRNKDGVWVYGISAGPNLIPTHYVVGSVIPSMAGLSPYASPVQISSISSLSQLVAQPQSLATGSPPSQSSYMPDWLFNVRFMALGEWKESVDRVGVLHRINVPVAWRGNWPRVIYAWNGHSWHQMLARERERPASVLKKNLYALTKQVKRHGFIWYEADMPVLSQHTDQWGYYWMGEIIPR